MPPTHGPLTLARSLWRWRRVLVALAARDFRARYAGSALGAVWSVVEPAVQFGLYLVVFSYFLGMRFELGPGVSSFGMYLVAGLVPFLALQESLLLAAGLLRANAPLVRQATIPLEVIYGGSFLAVMGRYAIALAGVTAASLAMGTWSWSAGLWLLGGVAMLVAAAFGLGLVAVVVGGYLPDTTSVLSSLLTVMFFLTPVVYPASVLPDAVRPFLPVNPLVGILAAFRAALAGGSVGVVELVAPVVLVVAGLAAGGTLLARRASALRMVV